MARFLRSILPEIWRSRGPVARLLLPFAWAYIGAIQARRLCYRVGVCRVVRFPKPVVVVGGITAGGSGKTPLVMYVASLLIRGGWKPGIVSRGYGGRTDRAPLMVERTTPVDQCGDEPLMMARRLGVPVVVDPKRPRGVAALLSAGCDIVVSDDGLQHYAMDRQVEITVLGGRGVGNGYCLPAGPLREPIRRLARVDMVVRGAGAARPGEYRFTVRLDTFNRLDGRETRRVADFRGRRVHAVAGIANPEGFFEALHRLGIEVEAHPFPDHHPYRFGEFLAMQDAPIVMTEKDAVKCTGMPLGDVWYAPLSVTLDRTFDDKLSGLLKP